MLKIILAIMKAHALILLHAHHRVSTPRVVHREFPELSDSPYRCVGVGYSLLNYAAVVLMCGGRFVPIGR